MGDSSAAGGAAAAAATGGISTLVQAGIGVLEFGVGAIQKGRANKKLAQLMGQRTLYTTPDQFYDAFNLSTQDAQTGYGAEQMQYFTDQTDRALSSSLGAATRLGADPNDIANIFDRSVSAIMKNNADSEMIKLQKFNRVYNTLNILGEEKKAEWADKEALLKDKMAAQAMKAQAGAANMQSGANMALGALANAGTDGLFNTSSPDQSLAPSLTSDYRQYSQVTARPQSYSQLVPPSFLNG